MFVKNKAKIMCKCAKRGPSKNLMCRQRTILNQITSNDLPCEMDFHAEANFQQNEKLNLLSANKLSV